MGEDTAVFVSDFFETGLHPISLALGERAARIASRHRLRGADSIYVATADGQNATLVTWDQEMLNRGAAVVDTCTPEEWMEAKGHSE